MPHHTAEVTRKVFELIDGGQSQEEVQRLTGVPQPTISRWLKTRAQAATNGTPTSAPSEYPSTPTALERTIIMGEPVSTPYSAPSTLALDVLVSRVDAHDQRLDVLEAFMQAMQQQAPSFPTSTPSTPEYTAPREWKKSGVEYAVDMPDKLRAYAKTHGFQVREVVDMALREFFAAHDAPLPVPTSEAEGVRHDA